MNKKQIKGLTVLMAVILVIAMLAGCGTKVVQPDGSTATAATTTAATTTVATTEAPAVNMSESWKRYKDTPVELKFFVNHSSEKSTDNPLYQAIIKETGVTPIMESAGTNANEKLNIYLATNDLPDLIWTAHLPQMVDAANEGQLWSISELSAEYAPDVVNNMNDNQKLWYKMNFDNKEIFGIPGFYHIDKKGFDNPILPKNDIADMLVKEIYEEFGKPDISTTEALLDLLRKVKQKYPDMIPICIMNNWGVQWNINSRIMGFASHFGLGGLTEIELLEHPNFLKMLKFVNTLYNEGLMSPTDFTDDTRAVRNSIERGLVFYVATNNPGRSLAFNEGLGVNEVSNRTIIPVEPFVLSGEKYERDTFNGGITGSYTAISKSTKYPERAIALMDWLLSDRAQLMNVFGANEEYWTQEADGYGAWTQKGIDKYTEIGKAAFEQTYGQNFLQFFRSRVHAEYQGRENNGWNAVGQQGLEWNAMTNKYYKDFFRFAPTIDSNSEEAKINSALRDYFSGEVVKMVVNKPENLEANFNAMMEGAKRLGYDELKAFYQSQEELVQQKIDLYSK